MRPHTRTLGSLFALLLTATVLFGAASPALAQNYELDPGHTSVYFKIKHLDVSYVFGRFNDVEGQYTLGDDPSFQFTVQTESVDTGNQKRDDHLRSPDFFNAKQFRTITFQSTSVSETDDGYEVTGDLTLHGQTNEITVPLEKVGEGEDPWGGYRTGFATEFTIKRSDYGMDQMLEMVGDEVTLMISFEGKRQQEE